jgi:hypothetical protein
MKHGVCAQGLARVAVLFGVVGCTVAPDSLPGGGSGAPGTGGFGGSPPNASAGAFGAGAAQAGSAAVAGTPSGGSTTGGEAAAGSSAGITGGSAGAGGVSGGSAGAGGVSGGSAGGAGSATGCVGSSFALCDDFESGAIDKGVWMLATGSGAVTLDPSRGARGSQASVHVHVNIGGDAEVGIRESKTFPTLAKAFFSRAFIFIPALNSQNLFTGDLHTRLMYGNASNGEYALGIWNGGIIQNHYNPNDDSKDTKLLPPFDQWFCLEWELDSDGSVKAYLDDAEITALRAKWPPAMVQTLTFGATRFGNFKVAEELWFDDIAVDSQRIGCTR